MKNEKEIPNEEQEQEKNVVSEYTLPYDNQNIIVRYYSDRNLIKCIGGISYDRTFQFIQELIISRDIGTLDSIIYYISSKHNVVWLIRGDNINGVLRKPRNTEKNDKLSFSQILENKDLVGDE